MFKSIRNTENPIHLRIAYLAVQMPVPSEAFLALEVAELATAGMQMSVYCIRKPHGNHTRLQSEMGLDNVPLHYSPYILSMELWLAVLYWAIRYPIVLLSIMWTIVRSCWRKPHVLALSFAILPKSIHIARQVSREKIQIVHAAWGHYPAVTAYLIKKLIPDIQVTLALGAYDWLTRHPMTCETAQIAACIFTQSQASANRIIHEWPRANTPVEVVWRGVSLERIQSAAAMKSPYLIVSAGRLIAGKGHQYTIRALPAICDIFPGTHLVVLGNGNYQTNLEGLVHSLNLESNVTFTGHVTQAELYQYMAKAQIFILVSFSENLPNTVKEAMAIGLPVITTPTTAIEELVVHEENGLIVPMSDPEAITSAVIRLFTESDFAHNIAIQAQQTVSEKADVKKTTQQRIQVFYQVLDGCETNQ